MPQTIKLAPPAQRTLCNAERLARCWEAHYRGAGPRGRGRRNVKEIQGADHTRV